MSQMVVTGSSNPKLLAIVYVWTEDGDSKAYLGCVLIGTNAENVRLGIFV